MWMRIIFTLVLGVFTGSSRYCRMSISGKSYSYCTINQLRFILMPVWQPPNWRVLFFSIRLLISFLLHNVLFRIYSPCLSLSLSLPHSLYAFQPPPYSFLCVCSCMPNRPSIHFLREWINWINFTCSGDENVLRLHILPDIFRKLEKNAVKVVMRRIRHRTIAVTHSTSFVRISGVAIYIGLRIDCNC